MSKPINPSLLNSRTLMAEIDKSNVLGSIEALTKQVKHAWDSVQSIKFTPQAEIRNVVVAGMGGSGLGADVIKTLYKEQLTVPFDFVHDYTLPGYINQHSLVVLASYSGTTEEVLACAGEAQAKQAQIMVICAGGTLAELAAQKGYTAYIIDPVYNPSNQPRMAIGYAVFGTLGLLAKANVIQLSDAQVQEVIATIAQTLEQNRVEVDQAQAQAKMLAFAILDRRPVLVVADFLEGAAHVSNNQFNENAKIYCDYKIVPEIDHHLLEGLSHPSSNVSTHLFVFVNSSLYHPSNQLRMNLSQQAVSKHGLETSSLELTSQSRLTQVFELITVLGLANFYLAMLEKIDPAPIPTVDWFKVELKKLTATK